MTRGKYSIQWLLNKHYAEESRDWTTRRTRPVGTVLGPDGSTPTCDIMIQLERENGDHAGNQCDINAAVMLPSVSNGVQNKSVKAIIKTIVTKGPPHERDYIPLL